MNGLFFKSRSITSPFSLTNSLNVSIDKGLGALERLLNTLLEHGNNFYRQDTPLQKGQPLIELEEGFPK